MEVRDNLVVLKCNDIGYELICSNVTVVDCSEIGKQIQLFTYLQVREDGISLYGFSTPEEKNMFLSMLSVSGIGPKMAIGVLSGISVNDLAIAIVTGDINALTRIKGLGKKTAERLILELKEKISPLEALSKRDKSVKSVVQSDSNTAEALGILMSLGLNKAEANRRINKAIEDGCVSSENILNHALKNK